MPFGLSVSPEIFQHSSNEVLKDLPNVKAYQDDIIVWGSTRQHHDKNLLQLPLRLKDKNVTINSKKSTFAKEKLLFLGFRVNA